ncbi:MAG: ribulose-phosphate 3-epimerase [Thermoleophilaceae bacterium]|jgi:ribulose-phosphate 3-epimerase|nr:ribulose-phosphate 3-epimerase [Thermoleophilaceae bacterium]
MQTQILREPRVAPSILSADFAHLGQQVAEVMDAGARVIHCDVMDGHFVPPITLGPLIVGSLADQVHGAGGILDVHLMIERPERHIEEFAKAGADLITIHWEATPHVHYALKAVRDAGCMAGLALTPATPAEVVTDVAGDVDNVLCMTVNPGWGGQPFIDHSVAKLERMRALLPAGLPLEVDGGIDADTAPRCAGAGATLFVAGSAVFGAADPGQAYLAIASAIEGG